MSKNGTEDDILAAYIAGHLGFQRVYDRYEPDDELIEQIAGLQPEAHVVIVSATWCPDCRRNVPRWARITERLPGWRTTLYAREDKAYTASLGVRAIPTFIIYDPETNSEIGRIIENPISGSLESDILRILRSSTEGEVG